MPTSVNILVWNVMNLGELGRPGDFGSIGINARAQLIGKMIGTINPLPDLIILLETGSNGKEVGDTIATNAYTGTTVAYSVLQSEDTADRNGPETYTMLLNTGKPAEQNSTLLNLLGIEFQVNGNYSQYADKFKVISKLHSYRGGLLIPLTIGTTTCNLGIIHSPFSTPDDVPLPAGFTPDSNQTINRRMAVSHTFAQQLGDFAILAGDFNIPVAKNQKFRDLMNFSGSSVIFPEWGPKDSSAPPQPEQTSLRQLRTIMTSQHSLLNPYDQAYVTAQASNLTSASSRVVKPNMTDRFKGPQIRAEIENVRQGLYSSLTQIHRKSTRKLPTMFNISTDPSKPQNQDVTDAINKKLLEEDFDFASSFENVMRRFPDPIVGMKRTKYDLRSAQLEKIKEFMFQEEFAKHDKDNKQVKTHYLVEFCQTLQRASRWKDAVTVVDSFTLRDIPVAPSRNYFALYRSVISDHLPINITIEVP